MCIQCVAMCTCTRPFLGGGGGGGGQWTLAQDAISLAITILALIIRMFDNHELFIVLFGVN